MLKPVGLSLNIVNNVISSGVLDTNPFPVVFKTATISCTHLTPVANARALKYPFLKRDTLRSNEKDLAGNNSINKSEKFV